MLTFVSNERAIGSHQNHLLAGVQECIVEIFMVFLIISLLKDILLLLCRPLTHFSCYYSPFLSRNQSPRDQSPRICFRKEVTESQRSSLMLFFEVTFSRSSSIYSVNLLFWLKEVSVKIAMFSFFQPVKVSEQTPRIALISPSSGINLLPWMHSHSPTLS